MQKTIIVAGGTGNLGDRIIQNLIAQSATVKAIVRSGTDMAKIAHLQNLGATVVTLDMSDKQALAQELKGASCVVSALAGLRDVIFDLQKDLLDAAIVAGVPRFIPSDFSLDFINFSIEENRNLGFRKEFQKYLETTSIRPTTIFNGAFMDMLTGEMPLILFKPKRILAWGNADQKMEFTTVANVAEYTAHVALDDSSPRFLRIAGDQISARDLSNIVGQITGEPYKLLRPGGLGLFKTLIAITKLISPGKKELYPAWQGMQYLHNMLDGRGRMQKIDNERYAMKWKSVTELLEEHFKGK